MSLFSLPQVYFAADDGGTAGAPGTPAPAPKGVSPAAKTLEKQLKELSDTNKRIYKLLSKSLGLNDQRDEESSSESESMAKSFGDIFQESVTDPLKDLFNFEDLFGGMFGGDDDSLLGGLFGESKEKPKEKPKLSDMMKMPAEHSLGYTLLYWKLDEIAGLLQGEGSDKEEKGKGIGGFFKGLLKGAVGLAVLAGSMMLFAGALLLFTQLEGSDWAKALAGIGMFALFVAGAVVVAKAVSANEKVFFDFAKGVLTLTASLILFGAAIFVMAWVRPYVPDAIDGMALFGVFVLGAVGVSRLVGNNLQSFAQFGLGMIALTGALILFGGAIFVMNWVEPYIPGALNGIGLFVGFAAVSAILARIVGSQLASFAQFGMGTLLMIAGLVLFAGAVWLVNKMVTLEQLEHAAIVAGAMLAFVAVVGLLGLAMAPLLPGLGAIAVGALALTASMALFALGIAAVRDITIEDIEQGSFAIGEMAGLMREAGRLGYRSALAIPGLVLFAAATVALSTGMVAFGLAIRAVANSAEALPIAIPALQEMMKFLSNPDGGIDDEGNPLGAGRPGVLQLLDAVAGVTMLKLAAFGAALIPFSVGMSLFAETIRTVAEVGEYVPAGLDGLERMMTFLSNPDGAMDEDGRLNGGRPGVLQLLDGVSRQMVRRLRQFGRALDPFFTSMLTFAEVIQLIANVGDAAVINRAIDGVGRMMNLLVGGGDVAEGSDLASIFSSMEYRVAPLLESFGRALNPLMSSLLTFANVIERVAGRDGTEGLTPDMISVAGTNLSLMYALLHGEANSITVLLAGISPRFSQSLEDFGNALEPFMGGLLTFTEVIQTVSGMGEIIGPAINSLNLMIRFLGEAGAIADDVGSGGFLGLGQSSMDKFEEAIEPFGNGIRDFMGIVREIAGEEENIQSSNRMLHTMTRMLTAAGATVGGSGSPDNVEEFKDSLDLLGDGINRFTGQIEGTNPFVLDRIADALERIAEIQFGQMFTPFITFMSHNEELRETATQLERINDAITPREPTTLDRIGGAIGSIFNRGGDRANLNDGETASYVASPGVDGSMEGYVAGMYDILSRWDQNPIQLPSGEGGTNMMVMQSGGRGERAPAFGGNFGN